jgi:hypothetical protein
MYSYKVECIPFDFVSGNSDPTSENNDRGASSGDLTAIFGSSVTVGGPGLIYLDELQNVIISSSIYPYEGIPSRGLERIRERQPSIIRRAKELRAILGDPIAGLVHVLQDIPVEDGVWDRIAQEPYG